MNLYAYKYFSDKHFLAYDFISSGPKGNINKSVRFSLIPGYSDLYNLAFGDLDEITGEIQDIVVSNNSDMTKILATIAKIAVDFIAVYPAVSIFVTGSTPSRTRLYQMNINKYWQEISRIFEIKGLENGEWKPFEKNKNYNAFLAYCVTL